VQIRNGPATVTGDTCDRSARFLSRSAIAACKCREKASTELNDPEVRIQP
jgi:hypothetical protein